MAFSNWLLLDVSSSFICILSIFAHWSDMAEGESDWKSLDHRLMWGSGSERICMGWEGVQQFPIPLRPCGEVGRRGAGRGVAWGGVAVL